MKSSINRSIASLGLALGALSFLPAANAALVEYTFVATPDSGPLAGQSFNGSFTYEDTDVPTAGFNGEDLFSLSSFSFSFDNVPVVIGDLAYGFAAVEAGLFVGLDVGASTFSMLPGLAGSDPFFSYDLTPTGGAGSGELSFQLVTNSVPEPGTAGLLAVALLGIAGLRRSR